VNLAETAPKSEENGRHGNKRRPLFLGFDFFDTVDGQNPAPPRMMIIPLFIGF